MCTNLFLGGYFVVIHSNERTVQISHFEATINAAVAQVEDSVNSDMVP